MKRGILTYWKRVFIFPGLYINIKILRAVDMIRKFKESDMDQVLKIWLDASVKAHDFVERRFWESRLDDMRNIYLPAGENYVYEEDGQIKGFFALVDETLAAIFVDPVCQGRGIGTKLISKAKELRLALRLTVYCKNTKSVDFYKNCGFEIVEKQIDENTGEPEFLMVTGK
jgi:putative acetyltransferase